MKKSDFYYELPDAHIARYPLPNRAESRLMLLHPTTQTIQHHHFYHLPHLLTPGDLLIFNDSRVMKARLFGHKDSGGRVEILIERILNAQQVWAHIRASKAPRPGQHLQFEQGFTAEVFEKKQDLYRLHFLSSENIFSILEKIGHIPLPSYFKRADEHMDETRYQTIYAKNLGSVAAPTAGLHFDTALLDQLQQCGIHIGYITLHVGAGTFQPIRTNAITEHTMHAEYYEIPPAVCEQIAQCKTRKNRVIAVGTTSARALESAAQSGAVIPHTGETRLFISPGYTFRCIDGLITNFHLPESTLLVLVSALAGFDFTRKAYDIAITENYRFYSYGDGMLIIP